MTELRMKNFEKSYFQGGGGVLEGGRVPENLILPKK